MLNKAVFLSLVREGLWGNVNYSFSAVGKQSRQNRSSTVINYDEVLHFAKEQSVVGLVTAGIERTNSSFPVMEKLKFVGLCQLIEQRNMAMNQFIAMLVGRMQEAGIKLLLVKGQGVAQCYIKPRWRIPGDIDLLLDGDNYIKAKEFIIPLSEKTVVENAPKKHLSAQINGFTIELHGRMPFELSQRVDKVIDDVVANMLIKDCIDCSAVRVWNNEDTDVLLPNANDDVIIVFTHFLHHFFIEGVGLKQICDWCRLLWTYRLEIDVKLLEKRLKEAGLMSEWKAFAALAVNTLGMPEEAMPFYDSLFKHKGKKVMKHVLKTGYFGHNKDLSYRVKYKGLTYMIVSLWRRFIDFVGLTFIFPLDTPQFFVTYVLSKVR